MPKFSCKNECFFKNNKERDIETEKEFIQGGKNRNRRNFPLAFQFLFFERKISTIGAVICLRNICLPDSSQYLVLSGIWYYLVNINIWWVWQIAVWTRYPALCSKSQWNYSPTRSGPTRFHHRPHLRTEYPPIYRYSVITSVCRRWSSPNRPLPRWPQACPNKDHQA